MAVRYPARDFRVEGKVSASSFSPAGDPKINDTLSNAKKQPVKDIRLTWQENVWNPRIHTVSPCQKRCPRRAAK